MWIRLQMTLALDASHTKVSIMVQEHIRQVNQKDADARGAAEGLEGLTPRDLQRLRLRRSAPLPVPFRVVSTPLGLEELQGLDFK
ncbi:unnamed protein product, partial [Effrenium voratum]